MSEVINPPDAAALSALHDACRAVAANIAEFDTITDPEFLDGLLAALERVVGPDIGLAELEAHWKAGFLRGAKHWYGVAQGVPEAQQWTMWQSEQNECWAAAHACWPPAPGALEDARQICALHQESVKGDAP